MDLITATDEQWCDLARAVMDREVPWPRGLSGCQQARFTTVMRGWRCGSRANGWYAGRYVCFVRDRQSELIKIGCSRNPWSSHNSTYGHELWLMAACPGGRTRKRLLHRRFAASHVRGDWFRPAADVLAFVDQLRTPVRFAESVAFFRTLGFDFEDRLYRRWAECDSGEERA